MNNENEINTVGNLNNVNVVDSSYSLIEEEPINDNISDVKEEDKNVIPLVYENSFKGLYKYITTRDTIDLLKLLGRIVIIVALIALCYFPFNILKGMGAALSDLMNLKLSDSILKAFYFFCDFGYGIFALIAFVMVISARYKNLVVDKKK